MLLTAQIMSIICYGLLAWQDFKHRQFLVVLIPLLCLSNLAMAYTSLNEGLFITTLKLNGLFIGALFLILYLIHIFKEGSFSFPKNKIGLGDILIVLTLIPLFVPLMFKVVFLSVALSGILFGLLYTFINRSKETKIPLAGLFAIVCAVLITLDISGILKLYHDFMI